MSKNEIKKIVIVLILFAMANLEGFCANVQNSKQIENEKKEAVWLQKMVEDPANTPIMYMVLISEDALACEKNSKTKCIRGDLMTFVTKYEQQPQSDSYKFSLQAYKLYDEMAANILKREYKTAQFQKIIIPDNVYDALDKQVIRNVALVNIFVQKIYYPDKN